MLFWLADRLTRRGAKPIVVNRGISISLDCLFILSVVAFLTIVQEPTRAAVLSLLILIAVLVTITDLSRHLIPDWITLPGVVLGLSLNLMNSLSTFIDAAAAAVLLGGLLLALAWIWDRFLDKPDAMGGGDIKLAAMIGSFLGIQLGAWAIMLGAILTLIGYVVASPFGHRKTRVPFGPGLAWACLVMYGFANEILSLVTSYVP